MEGYHPAYPDITSISRRLGMVSFTHSVEILETSSQLRSPVSRGSTVSLCGLVMKWDPRRRTDAAVVCAWDCGVPVAPKPEVHNHLGEFPREAQRPL